MNIQSMNCTSAAEALPWYLNGTLDTDETASLEAHLESCPLCRQEHRDTAFAAAAYATHPPAKDLVDFAFHRLTLSSRRGVVERHIKVCADCAEEVRLIETSRDTLAELETAGVDDPPRTPSQSIPIVREFRPRTASTTWWRSAALAASLAAIVGTGLFLWNLNPRTVDLAQSSEGSAMEGGSSTEPGDARASIGPSLPQLPSASPAGSGGSLVSIQPGSLNTATTEGIPTLEVPNDAQELSITLVVLEASRDSSLELQVLNAGDRVVWRGGVLNPAGDGRYTAVLPLEFVPSGTASLRVRQRNGSRTETLATLPFELIRR